jgi:hypothetical protein
MLCGVELGSWTAHNVSWFPVYADRLIRKYAAAHRSEALLLIDATTLS